MHHEPTSTDVLEAIHDFAANVDQRFDRIEGEMTGIKGEITGLKGEITGLKTEIFGIKGEISGIKGQMSEMVTKDYLDDKMADLRGDLIGVIRKEDAKVDALTGTLRDRDLLTSQELSHINAQGPFPKL